MDRGHKTDTTEDTSIEDGSSDGRSQSTRHDDAYDAMIFPTMLPPPPLLEEHTTTASVYDVRSNNSLQDINTPRRYNTMNGRAPQQRAIDNSVYASINRHRNPENSHFELTKHQDIPLPPPPPEIDPSIDLVDRNGHSLSRGMSQCSIAGCRSDTGTLNSNRSMQSKQSRRSRKESPLPTTHTPANSHAARSQRRGTYRESMELASTNL